MQMTLTVKYIPGTIKRRTDLGPQNKFEWVFKGLSAYIIISALVVAVVD